SPGTIRSRPTTSDGDEIDASVGDFRHFREPVHRGALPHAPRGDREDRGLARRCTARRIGDGGARGAAARARRHARADPHSRARTTPAGVVWSCVSGLCICGAMMLLFVSLRSGGPVSATGPIVLGGGVTLAALAAPLFFAEGFTLRRGIGIGLGLVAIVILAT